MIICGEPHDIFNHTLVVNVNLNVHDSDSASFQLLWHINDLWSTIVNSIIIIIIICLDHYIIVPAIRIHLHYIYAVSKVSNSCASELQLLLSPQVFCVIRDRGECNGFQNSDGFTIQS